MKGRETVQALLDGKFIVHIYNPKQAWRLEDDGLYFHNPKVNAWFRAPKDATFHLLMASNFTECEKTEILLNARIIRTMEDLLKAKYENFMHYSAESE